MTLALVLGLWLSDRRSGGLTYGREWREFRRRRELFVRDLDRARVKDQKERRAAFPDPAEVLQTATGPGRRLWERRLTDEDRLCLRVGLADRPALLEMVPETGARPAANAPVPPISRSVPVTLCLPRLGVVGLTGPRERSIGLARWLIGQAAALHSPRDLSIVVLSTSGRNEEAWNWVRWLPHTTPRSGERCVVLVGGDPEAAAARVAELTAKITDRIREPGRRPSHVLVILDGAHVLRDLPGMAQVLREGPGRGIFTLAIDEAGGLLPGECAMVAETTAMGTVRLSGGEPEKLGEALSDQVDAAWCDRLARALAPIREVDRADGAAAIPSSVRLLDLLGDPDPERIRRQWGRSTRVPMGVGPEGIFEIDLGIDGPHALIAGTTGSGRSELLRSLIAGLAAANRPDEMAFVLIDCVGGSSFKDCARLPHAVRTVTGLDGYEAERALAYLAAEVRRRERLLEEAGAKDVEEYAPGAGGTTPPPRLVLVIDEVATLLDELPDFVAGLVNIARRGRSLGIHLIVATGRPAEAVTPDIRANTRLRIALRVAGAAESQGIIDAGDAARISKGTPGRCYVRSGAGKPKPVQSALIGGRRTTSAGGPGPRVWPLSWRALGHPLPVTDQVAGRSSRETKGVTEGVTDLSALVDAVRSAAAGLDLPPSPWPPPLPERVTVDEIPDHPGDGDGIPFGLTDLPGPQSRRPLVLDLPHGGHMLIAGAPRTGRTTALRTIAGSLARSMGPADAHLYAVDCGSGALLPLVALPHCGAVVTRDQTDRLERLLVRLREELRRRQEILTSGGFSSPAEARAAGRRLPWMLLLIDGWEGFLAAYENHDHGRLVNSVLTLLREGIALGLRAVVTAGRSRPAGQFSTVFDARLALRMPDPDDYGPLTIPAKRVPAAMPPGRALSMTARGPVESQIALLGPDGSGQAQAAAVQAIARRYEPPPRRERPLHVDVLPGRITYTDTLALDPGFEPPSPMWVLFGAGGDELAPAGVDLAAEGPGCVVVGPPRSGRSTALATAARWLVSRRVTVVLIAPRRTPLTELEGVPGVLGVLDAKAEHDPAELRELLHGSPEPASARSDDPRFVVIVDDCGLISHESPLGEELARILISGRNHEHGLLLAGAAADLGNQGRGYVHEALRSRTGLLLSGHGPVVGGEVFGVRPQRGTESGGPDGRALLVKAGRVSPLQVALPS